VLLWSVKDSSFFSIFLSCITLVSVTVWLSTKVFSIFWIISSLSFEILINSSSLSSTDFSVTFLLSLVILTLDSVSFNWAWTSPITFSAFWTISPTIFSAFSKFSTSKSEDLTLVEDSSTGFSVDASSILMGVNFVEIKTLPVLHPTRLYHLPSSGISEIASFNERE